MRPLLLDLFCGAGGAAMGYHRAGFDVVGVDIKPQLHYPFPFIQGDALNPPVDLSAFDVIHASPPCQAYSKSVKKANRGNHPDRISQTRVLLRESGLPYVIENVPGAPLVEPIRLCGSSFGVPIKRHRYFESSIPLLALPCVHGVFPRRFAPAWNRTTRLRFLSPSNGYLSERDEHDAEFGKAMDIDWMTIAELSQAIPPAYTQFIGEQLMEHLNRREVEGMSR